MNKHNSRIDDVGQARTTKDEPSRGRRQFLQKSALGASLVSLPAQSVWAGRLVSGAMSTGTSWAPGPGITLSLRSPGYFKQDQHALQDSFPLNQTFSDVFGGNPFGPRALATDTLSAILNNPGNGTGNGNGNGNGNGAGGGNQDGIPGLGGPSNVNVFLICMYLNAYFHNRGSHNIIWPVVSNGLFDDANDYAIYLYSQAASSPGGVGTELANIVCEHHQGSVCSDPALLL